MFTTRKECPILFTPHPPISDNLGLRKPLKNPSPIRHYIPLM